MDTSVLRETSSQQIHHALLKWSGVESGPGRFGSVTYTVAGREVGHVHGNSHADLPLPLPLRNELVESGKAQPHHVLPRSGWVTVPIAGLDDVSGVLAIFRINYDLIVAKKKLTWPSDEG